ncbi:FAD/NAD(P)-binding domain-containing protein [Aspergillus ibericus CBS 121593]|uniref:FAD/NAD(P)-binding domain-containing protein n=1 Tax=Aspergillus ibericus CBS 121593 TaxID=1448316 RepID=A0A395H2E0_9EURO|nr:FAD/NAD(P)-binding domain-containing protein [Aspergillus ibericus CBS 121593]RAL01833.1 FAD/NAD(P)-binding domain-containing protein [Aspergillus ibericus CBS 121593]
MPLTIAIIGSGLAGCLAARILREQHTVTIYERDPAKAEAGAAINLGPSAVHILDSVGFDRRRARSIPVTRVLSYSKSGNVTQDDSLDYVKEFGADWLFHHRADLRDELLRLATGEADEVGVKGEPAKVRYGARVVDGDVEGGRLILEGGEVVEADLVVAADGIRSTLRPLVTNPSYTTAQPSGVSAFRFTMSRADVLALHNGNVPDVLDPTKPGTLIGIYAFDPTERRVILYPCRNYEILNFVALVPDNMLKEPPPSDSWSAPGDREELISLFEDFPDWVVKYFRSASNIKLWQLRHQAPLPSYIRGRTVLIGDAAHAMTPHQGQGGNQAIEDAEGFRLFLGDHVTRDTVPKILEDFDAVRRPRASLIQRNTLLATARFSVEEIYRFRWLNFTYPGIVEGVRRVRCGEEVVQEGDGVGGTSTRDAKL